MIGRFPNSRGTMWIRWKVNLSRNILGDKNQTKKLWKTLKSAVPNSKGVSTSLKKLVKYDGTEISCLKLIADHFNNFFVNAGAFLASKFSSDTTKINLPVHNNF